MRARTVNSAQLSSGIPRTLLSERESEAVWAKLFKQDMSDCECKPDRVRPSKN